MSRQRYAWQNPERSSARVTPERKALLDELGYQGVVGCEYIPADDTAKGLSWARAHGLTPRR